MPLTPNAKLAKPALSHKGRGSVAPSPLMGEGWDGGGEIGTGLLQLPP